MVNQDFINTLTSHGSDNLLLDEPLSKHTTIGIGGPAKYFLTVSTLSGAQQVLETAAAHGIPVMVLGGGSNVVIRDQGFDGLVLHCALVDFQVSDNGESGVLMKTPVSRLGQLEKQHYYDAQILPSSFTPETASVRVEVGSGWKLNALIQKCHSEEITGLEWFAGIPGTVGGAVYMNIHGGTYYFSDFVTGVHTLDLKGQPRTYTSTQLDFDYDFSRFHTNREFIVSVTLRLYKGDLETASKIIQQWGTQKITKQPQRSAGCMFQNLSQEEQVKLGLPTSSIGYVIDKILCLSGKEKGDAWISPRHCAFIENKGNATASDVKSLVELVEKKFLEKYHFPLKREVEFI